MLEQTLDWSEEARGAPKEGTDKTREVASFNVPLKRLHLAFKSS